MPGWGLSACALVLTRTVASREVVERACEVVLAAGVRPGMDLAQVRGMVPAGVRLRVQEHEAAGDAEALRALAGWCLRFAPLCAPDGDDGLVLDITGTERLHRRESRLIRAVAQGVEGLGYRARVAVASTPACAWAVSRFGRHTLARVPPGREREALEGLPTAALRVSPEIVRGLGEIGITRVGEVLRLPRASLAARFDLRLVRRVMQALGEAPETFDPVRPEPPVRREILFDGPTDHAESIACATRDVLEALVGDLERRQRGVRRLRVAWRRPRVEPVRIQIDLSRPSRSLKHLWTLVRQRLERVEVGGGEAGGVGEGVEGVEAWAVRTAPLRHEQMESRALGGAGRLRGAESGAGAGAGGGAGRGGAAWGELIDTLTARLGPEGVLGARVRESHLPERAFVLSPMLEEAGEGARTGAARAAITARPRPTLLLPRPEPARVMALTPDGPVISVGWRGAQRSVVACSTPERLGAEWWRWSARLPSYLGDPRDRSGGPGAMRPPRRASSGPPLASPPPDRDYFAVQTDDGRWLWVCRQVGGGSGGGRWFVHGEWG